MGVGVVVVVGAGTGAEAFIDSSCSRINLKPAGSSTLRRLDALD